MRLDKYLCDCGIGTRSEVKNYIKKNRVTVNETPEKDPGRHVTEDDLICFDSAVISYNKYTYIIMNKPSGVITAREDLNEKTVMDLVQSKAKNLSPVGRLDKDTEGLLLITNDGILNHNMLSPSKHVDKKYYIETRDVVDDDAIRRLSEGVDIGDDKITLPALAEKVTDKSLYLTIHEGRFHQVKRMLEAVNNKVIYLKRCSFGDLILTDDLGIGEYRELNLDEIELIKRYR